MDLFGAFSLILVVAFLGVGFLRLKLAAIQEYYQALALLILALILYYPLSALFVIGVYLSFVARPLGFVLGLLSFRALCRALMTQTPEQQGNPRDGA